MTGNHANLALQDREEVLLSDLALVVQIQGRISNGNCFVLNLGALTQEGDSLGTMLFPVLVFLTQGRCLLCLLTSSLS